jgi:thymidylate synthase
MELNTMLPTSYDSLDDVQRAALLGLFDAGSETAPRGIATVENRGVFFTLADPRRRCILNRQRKWSFPLALGELCWHLSGSTLVDTLAYYSPAWRSFADSDGQIRGSCYGSKIFVNNGGFSPWTLVRQLLQSDADTRRALLYFNDPVEHLAPTALTRPAP